MLTHPRVFARPTPLPDALDLVAGAPHAALAVEHGATWVSQDRDFARFPGLRWTVAVGA